MSQNPAKRRCLGTETKKFVDFCNFVCKFWHRLASISKTLSAQPPASGREIGRNRREGDGITPTVRKISTCWKIASRELKMRQNLTSCQPFSTPYRQRVRLSSKLAGGARRKCSMAAPGSNRSVNAQPHCDAREIGIGRSRVGCSRWSWIVAGHSKLIRQMDPPVLHRTELSASYDVSMRKNRIDG